MAGHRYEKPITVGFVALGCPKNMVDSEKMLAEIGQAGFVITPELDNADVVVINTCGFIAPAKAEAIEVTKEIVGYKRKGGVGKVIVAGCLSQRMGAGLFDEIGDIDTIVGLGQRENIVNIIRMTLAGHKPAVYMDGRGSAVQDDRGRLLLTPPHWAYLRISEGCSHRCSFCTIPAIRGPFRSKSPELVLAEARELAANGAVELSIIAQDSACYGRDLKIKDGLVKLIGRLSRIELLKWIRLMYMNPSGINDLLIEAVVSSEKLVKYIDMPIQHINNEILRSMARPDSREKIQRLIEKLRSAMSDVVLRTTVMVGFPGETEKQFAELLDFINWAQFDALGCFRFYPESGTLAAELPGQIADEVKQQRFDELMSTQQRIVFAKNEKQIGREVLCLVDFVDGEGVGQGRFYGQGPHIDGLCLIQNYSGRIGEFVRVKIVDTAGYDFVVEQIAS